jgi:tyrosyl-DNA phosphodiesterase 2
MPASLHSIDSNICICCLLHVEAFLLPLIFFSLWRLNFARREMPFLMRFCCSGFDEDCIYPDLLCHKQIQMSRLPVKSFDRKPFLNSKMGRELCVADVTVGGSIKLVLATSHLESPCPGPPTWDQMFSKERVAQASESLNTLGAFRNAILCGDMNWDEKVDGPFPLPEDGGWIDAWAELKPGEDGWTYDTKANAMLSGNRKLQKRLDRFVCKLPDFKVESVEMVGEEAIPGVTYVKEKKARREIRQLVLPVLPSDHFGLVLTISSVSEDLIDHGPETTLDV